MNRFNYTFFEEFKRLDKLCGELYGAQNGVTHYIDDMKTVPENNYRHISGWNNDLRELTRLRHIRNYLAHTEGAFEEENCTQEDIDWILEFRNRILHQSDPIARLHQNANLSVKRCDLHEQKKHQQDEDIENSSWKDIFFAMGIAAVIIVIIGVIIFALL